MTLSKTADPLVRTWSELAYLSAEVACFTISPKQECEWTREARVMLGLAQAEPLKTWQDFERKFLQASAAEATDLPSVLASARALDVTVEVSGIERRIAVMLREVPDGSGRIAGILHDRTHSVQREAELLRAGEWRERLQQLGRWSLLGEIASGLAHELNQPLAAISTFAQAGERMLNLPEPRIQKASSLFHEVSEQALRAGDVIHRMRGLVKRQGSGEPQLLTCESILTDFRALADAIARTHHVRLEVAVPNPALRVSVDPSHIQQVLMSLFRNALDAMRETPPPQRAVLARAQAVDNTLEISITDTGPGVIDAVARELFRPFFSTKEDGTGLGLAVCRSTVAEYGGTLRFENASPGGARFIVGLPLAQ